MLEINAGHFWAMLCIRRCVHMLCIKRSILNKWERGRDKFYFHLLIFRRYTLVFFQLLNLFLLLFEINKSVKTQEYFFLANKTQWRRWSTTLLFMCPTEFVPHIYFQSFLTLSWLVPMATVISIHTFSVSVLYESRDVKWLHPQSE